MRLELANLQTSTVKNWLVSSLHWYNAFVKTALVDQSRPKLQSKA
jgi:hypothetical protein